MLYAFITFLIPIVKSQNWLGDTLVLNVTYDFTGQVGVSWWNSSGKLLYLREISGSVLNPGTRASLEGPATLIVKNTALYDNGTYTRYKSLLLLQLFRAKPLMLSFKVSRLINLFIFKT